MAKRKSSGGKGRAKVFAAAAIVAAAAIPPASEPGAVLHDYCRTLPDESGKLKRRVIEQHMLTPARAAAWQAELRQQGFKDAEFIPSKK
jgi:hypothetical protein